MPKFAAINIFGIFYQGLRRALGPRKGSRGKLHASDGFPWGFWFLYLIYIYIIFLQKEKQITRKAHAYAAIFAVA